MAWGKLAGDLRKERVQVTCSWVLKVTPCPKWERAALNNWIEDSRVRCAWRSSSLVCSVIAILPFISFCE